MSTEQYVPTAGTVRVAYRNRRPDGIGDCNTGCHTSDMLKLGRLADRIEEEA